MKLILQTNQTHPIAINIVRASCKDGIIEIIINDAQDGVDVSTIEYDKVPEVSDE